MNNGLFGLATLASAEKANSPDTPYFYFFGFSYLNCLFLL
jgi:hypothetical protein